MSGKSGHAQSDALIRRAASVQQGSARAATLGINDGLVSTLCLILAVAGAGGSQQAVVVAGFAGLLAGAISMAAGEWISVRSQVDLFQGVLTNLRNLVGAEKALVRKRLVIAFEKRGVDSATAKLAVEQIADNDERLYRLYASEVIGMNPDELGSPWRSAASSFLFFVVGSLIPLIPWLYNGTTDTIMQSTILTLIAAFGAGEAVAYASGKSMVWGGFRQVLITLFAAAVTYGIGMLFGVIV